MILALLLACADVPEECADAPEVTWDNHGHAFVTTYCVSCHSAHNTTQRYGAPIGVDFDTEDDLLRQADRVRVRVLEEQTMPVGGGVFEDDRYLLQMYLDCPPPT